MEKAEMIKNVRAMMEFADKQMKGVVKEEFELLLERTAYHYIKFLFRPKQGACIAFGDWSRSYERMFADFTTYYGGWCGEEDIFNYDNTPNHITRDDMMRLAMLRWNDIKEAIQQAIDKEKAIDNFTL